MDPVFIVKADGTREAFDSSKLRRSLTRSGASGEVVDDVVRGAEREVTDGMSTSQIYRRAFALLRQREKPSASRYSLRRAVLELGPTGFPFEDFVAEIFKAKGYATETDVAVKGFCVNHELDMVARKEGKCIGAEMKFHNKIGMKSDLKVALYVHARFEDIISRMKKEGERCAIDEGWLITNTKFTSDALAYGRCVNLKMVSWTYPLNNDLQDLIEETKVHPLTALTSLTKREKTELLRRKVVLCKSLRDNTNVMQDIGIKAKKVDEILHESEVLCQPDALV